MRLRSQLFWVISGLFIAVLLVILWVSTAGTMRYHEQQLASHAQDAATALSITLAQSLGKGDRVLAETQVLSVFDRGYFKRIEVLGADRSRIVLRELAENIQDVPDWFVTLVHIQTPPGEAFIGSGWRQLGKVLVISQPTFAYQHLWQTSEKLSAWLLVICLFALALMQLGLHFILKPLRAIEKTAHDVQNKIFEPIVQHPRAPELASVIKAMNQMSRRIGEMLDAETAKAVALQRDAYGDELTGLANRRGFDVRLTELLHGEFHFALGMVITVELDDMRMLIRGHGFAEGMRIMRTVAETAQTLFASLPFTILARSNEFSFAFVLADVVSSQAVDFCNTFRTQLLKNLQDTPSIQDIGIQVGAAFFNKHDDKSGVFARADLAVETARQSERNGLAILNEHTQNNSTLGSFGWRTLISTALTERRWRLLRQPVKQLGTTQTLLQTECMARLLDEHGELVPAANFLPMAARHQLMPDVDRAMLKLALDYLTTTSDDGVLVAVNLSPQSIVDVAFMDWFKHQIVQLGSKAQRLAIEITEFGAIRHVPAAMRIKNLMHEHGGKFGIDHFGLDPKALDLLRNMLPDYVKLTAALMAELEAVENTTEMLQSFVSLAHSLDVMVIALQVETTQQIDVLTAVRVDAGQGYYFGAPSA